MNIQGLVFNLQRTYFTEVVLFLIEIIAILIWAIYAPKNKISYLFFLYITFDLLILIINWILILQYTSPEIKKIFINITNTLVALFELFVYNTFFKQTLINTWIKKWSRYSFIFYSLITVSYTIYSLCHKSSLNSYLAYSVGALEFILLLPPCLVFYYQILNLSVDINLQKRPSFWIVTGIFFYSIISIPYYLLTTYISLIKHEYKYIYEATLFYLPFTINFIFLIKAFKCKKCLTI